MEQESSNQRAVRYRRCLVEAEKRIREASADIVVILNRLHLGQQPMPSEIKAASEAYKWGVYGIAIRIQGELAFDSIANAPEVSEDDTKWITNANGMDDIKMRYGEANDRPDQT